MNTSAIWIRSSVELGSMSPEFRKVFLLNKKILKAEAAISAHGIYKFYVNGKLGDDACLAPGWTAYHTRVEYQSYDITSLLKEKNTISIIGGRGWAYGRIGFAYTVEHDSDNIAVIADIKINYEDGSEEHIVTVKGVGYKYE